MKTECQEIVELLPYFTKLKALIDPKRVKDVNPDHLEEELYWFESNPIDAKYYVKTKSFLKGKKVKNTNNSVIAYAIGITDDLPSDRMTTKMGSLPDVDFDTTARDDIKEYLVKEYGIDRVCVIGTKGTLKLKSAIRAAFRAVYQDSYDVNLVNDLTKKVAFWEAEFAPEDQNEQRISETELLEECEKLDDQIKETFAKYPKVKEVVERLIGQIVSSGVHAGGICISNEPIYNTIPVVWDNEHKIYVTQADMKTVEKAGLIKYDFLGLKTLNIIADTRRLIRARRGVEVEKNKINLYDTNVYKKFIPPYMENEGVFQFKTNFAAGILKRIENPRSFSTPLDASIITASGRPGPVKAGLIDILMDAMNGKTKIQYDLPELEPILGDTYGCLIFQEQIMEILKVIGKFDDGEQAAFIKAVSKKDPETMKKYHEKYISNAKSQKIDEKKAQKVWDMILKFGEYGFNKAHSVSYAVTGYICQYLKEYYPLEFMAATLSHCKEEEFKRYYPAWQKHISPPSVNESLPNKYTISGNKIVMSLSDVTQVGEEAAKKVKERAPFKNPESFFADMDEVGVGKTAVNNLVLAGGLDMFKKPEEDSFDFRKKMIEEYICYANGVDPLTEDEKANGVTIEEKRGRSTKKLQDDIEYLRKVQSMDRLSMLIEELRLLKLSSFDYHDFLKNKHEVYESSFGSKILTYEELCSAQPDSKALFIGSIRAVEIFRVKNKESKIYGREMATITLTQRNHEVKVLVFPDDLKANDENGGLIRTLKPLYPLIVLGKVSKNDKGTLILMKLGVPGRKKIEEISLKKDKKKK